MKTRQPHTSSPSKLKPQTHSQRELCCRAWTARCSNSTPSWQAWRRSIISTSSAEPWMRCTNSSSSSCNSSLRSNKGAWWQAMAEWTFPAACRHRADIWATTDVHHRPRTPVWCNSSTSSTWMVRILMAVTVTFCTRLNFPTTSVQLVLSLVFVCGVYFRALDFDFIFELLVLSVLMSLTLYNLVATINTNQDYFSCSALFPLPQIAMQILPRMCWIKAVMQRLVLSSYHFREFKIYKYARFSNRDFISIIRRELKWPSDRYHRAGIGEHQRWSGGLVEQQHYEHHDDDDDHGNHGENLRGAAKITPSILNCMAFNYETKQWNSIWIQKN